MVRRPGPKHTLKLMEEKDYNLTRPDNMIIKELVGVIVHLHQRLSSLEQRIRDNEEEASRHRDKYSGV